MAHHQSDPFQSSHPPGHPPSHGFANPAPLSTPAILRMISNWANANADKLSFAMIQAGGWEGWAQLELAYALNSTQVEAQSWVGREANVYTNQSERCDIILKSKHDHATYVLELKCASHANAAAFTSGLTADSEKAGKGLAEPGTILVVGLCNPHDAHTFADALHSRGFNVYRADAHNEICTIWFKEFGHGSPPSHQQQHQPQQQQQHSSTGHPHPPPASPGNHPTNLDPPRAPKKGIRKLFSGS